MVFYIGLDDDHIFNPYLLFLLGKPELSRFRPEVVVPVKPLFSNRPDVRSVAGVVLNPYYLLAFFWFLGYPWVVEKDIPVVGDSFILIRKDASEAVLFVVVAGVRATKHPVSDAYLTPPYLNFRTSAIC
jgi:hypothetical protein